MNPLMSLNLSDFDVKGILVITEGRFHQVKRMFERVNCEVTELKRLSMGKLSLDESLKEGEYRELTQEEIEMLKD